jgi:hypothetical protein
MTERERVYAIRIRHDEEKRIFTPDLRYGTYKNISALGCMFTEMTIDDTFMHRDDGLPATVETNGRQTWFRKGKKHRTDGPAVWWPEFPSDIPYKEWCIDGVNFTFDAWCRELKKDPQEILFLKLKYHPDSRDRT